MEHIERLYDLKKPIPKARLKALREQLENLQGNILQGHGRDYSVCIFLRFKPGKQTAVKDWIETLARNNRFTSAYKQFKEIEAHRKDPTKQGDVFGSFFLSAKGYKYLGIALQGNAPFYSMQNAQFRLKDPCINTWEPEYQKKIHAMVLLADDKESRLLTAKNTLCDEVKDQDLLENEEPLVEYGRVMRNTQDRPVEHFGFVDGRSQPLFFESDIKRRERGKTNVWDPGAGPNVVLVPDLHEESKAYSGSYLVFRKLKQDVHGFKAQEKKLAKALGLTGKQKERAVALVVGRFRNGTPISLAPTPVQRKLVPNNFNYDDDPEGGKCPLQAHIRKLNPRQKDLCGLLPLIVRRGITYGKRKSIDLLPAKKEEVGLLFMCYQNNLRHNFEELQRGWANEPDQPAGQRAGIDPIIGQRNNAGEQKWPAHRGDAREKHRAFDFHGFVTLKGGEYFFAPSLHFLQHIPRP
jgi:Dyp-type peroxidase family